MKKIRSPLPERSQPSLLVYNNSDNFEKQKIPLRRIVAQFKKQHQNEHKRSGNSIKKVLKELSNLRKELKQIKTTNRSQQAPSHGLDMSTCRKIQAEIRKSSSPESNTRMKSHSSSNNKNSNSYKKQISTQTKGNMKDITEFSFSIDSKLNKSKNKKIEKARKKQSEQEDDDEGVNPHFAINQMQQTVFREKKDNKTLAQLSSKKQHVYDRIATIQANQQHQRHLNSIKNHLQIIQVTSSTFSIEQKLKLNIELERMSKHLSRIPAHTSNPEQYYESMQIYTRNLNNQLNNLALILNRCESNIGWLKEKKKSNEEFKCKQLDEVICKNCIENERKGLQKSFKSDLKKMNKQIKQCSLQLELKTQQLEKAHINIAILSNDNNKLKEQIQQISSRQSRMNEKNNKLSSEIERSSQIIQELNQSRQKEMNKVKTMDQDLRYYRQEIQKIRTHKYGYLENQRQYANAQNRVKDLEMVIKQLKQKQILYQSVIKEKEAVIQDIKNKINSPHHHKILTYSKQQNHSEQSIDSAEFYKQKVELQEKNRQIQDYITQIVALKKQIEQLSLVNRQTNNSLDLCLMQINKLHAQIDDLEAANQKYKDKNLKNRIINERKVKRQAQTSNRKGKALQQINQLIKHHREIASKDIK